MSTLQNIEQLHEAIKAGLAAKLSGLGSIGHYPASEDGLALPAVLVTLADMKPGRDPGSGEQALTVRLQARLLVNAAQAKAEIAVRELAARLALALKNENWGLPVGMAQFAQAGPDPQAPAAGRLAWLVEWSHDIELGAPAWPYGDESKLALMLGLDPETGRGKEAQYRAAGQE